MDLAFDIGTGTGVVAALLLMRGVKQVIATDNSESALRCAQDNLQRLTEIYSADVHFQDPLHQVNGMAALTNYFANLYQNITHIEFDIHQSSRMLNYFEKNGFIKFHREGDRKSVV